MHKWNARIQTADGKSFAGRAKIISESQVAVRGTEVLPVRTSCRVGIDLPNMPDGNILRQLDIQCSVSHVVFGANGIRLELSVESIRPEDREVLRQHGRQKAK